MHPTKTKIVIAIDFLGNQIPNGVELLPHT